MLKRRDFLFAQRGTGDHRDVEETLQHRPSAQRARLSSSSAAELDYSGLKPQKAQSILACEGSALALPGFAAFSARMAARWGGDAAPAIPAAESALGFHPWRALSSAQVIDHIPGFLDHRKFTLKP
jgi:hypothetical protein